MLSVDSHSSELNENQIPHFHLTLCLREACKNLEIEMVSRLEVAIELEKSSRDRGRE